MIKTCNNCGYGVGDLKNYGVCLRTGFYMSTQRNYPNSSCNRNFSGWTPKDGEDHPPELKWWQRIFKHD